MELDNLMKTLTLTDSERPTATQFNVFGLDIGANHTDIVFGDFKNKCMVVATQYYKIGSLLKVSIDQVVNGIDSTEPVYTVNIVFGEDNLEQQVAARYIAEKLNISKPLLIFLCLKDYSKETVNTIVEALQRQPHENPESTST